MNTSNDSLKFKKMDIVVGFIMDGNRRWGKKYSQSLSEAYAAGAHSFFNAILACLEKAISGVVFYMLSKDNFDKREKRDLSIIYDVALSLFKKSISFFIKNCIKCLFIGVREKYSKEIIGIVDSIEKKTDFCNPKMTVYILLIYDPILDIKNFYLMNKLFLSAEIPKIDIVIRSGGQRRLSGFLPMQSMYSNIFVTEKLWPDINKSFILGVLDKMMCISNNYGK